MNEHVYKHETAIEHFASLHQTNVDNTTQHHYTIKQQWHTQYCLCPHVPMHYTQIFVNRTACQIWWCYNLGGNAVHKYIGLLWVAYILVYYANAIRGIVARLIIIHEIASSDHNKNSKTSCHHNNRCASWHSLYGLPML